MGKRGTRPGTKFSNEHRQNMSISRRNSEKFQAHLRRLKELLKGRSPVPEAICGSRATRALARMGLSREEAPELWEQYLQYFLEESSRRHQMLSGNGQPA